MASSARSQTTDDVEKLTGHAPRSLAEFVADRAIQVGELQPTDANELLAVELTGHPARRERPGYPVNRGSAGVTDGRGLERGRSCEGGVTGGVESSPHESVAGS